VLRFNEPGFKVGKSSLQKILKLIVNNDFNSIDWVVLSGSLSPGIPDKFYGTIIEKIHTRTVKTFIALDADGTQLKNGVVAKPDLIKPNIWELQRLISRKIRRFDQIKRAGQYFLNNGINFVLITMGENGSLGFSKQGCFYVKVPQVKCLNSVGCGDVFLGGFILKFSETKNFAESLRYAASAGTAKASKFNTDVPGIEDVKKILKKTSIQALDALSERTKKQLLREMPEKKSIKGL